MNGYNSIFTIFDLLTFDLRLKTEIDDTDMNMTVQFKWEFYHQDLTCFRNRLNRILLRVPRRISFAYVEPFEIFEIMNRSCKLE